MTAIFDFFDTLFTVIKSVFDSGMWLLKAIPSLLFSIGSVYAYAPEFLLSLLITCASLTVTFAVVKMIL